MGHAFEIDWDEVDVVHVAPTFGPAHDTESDDSCWCAPEVERVPRDDGTFGALVVHRSMN